MGMDDLSYLDQLMGGGAEETGAGTGGVWVLSQDGALDDGLLRLVGKARVLADSLGTYVYLLLGGSTGADEAQRAVLAGADQVLLAAGVPSVPDLVEFFGPRAPQVVLLPRTLEGRRLGSGLAQLSGGSLCGHAADLVVDPIYQRVVAHQPVLGDEARLALTLLNSPAIAVVDTGALPAAFSEPWRTGQIEEAGVSWSAPAGYASAEFPAVPVTLANAPLVVGVGRGLRDQAGFAAAQRLAEALGGVIGGDVGALDAGWIGEEQLVGLTGSRTSPRLYLALGLDGDTEHLAAVQGAGTIVAVQPDPAAPITHVADWNVIADPAEFAGALLAKLGV